MSTDTGSRVISGHLARELHRLVVSHERLRSRTLARELTALRVVSSGRSLRPRTLRVDGDTLVVRCELDSPDGSLSGLTQEAWSGLHVEGDCEGGATFTARVADVAPLAKGGTFGVELSCDEWTFHERAGAPWLWAGLTSATLPPGGGNLTLTTPGGFGPDDHYCLEGSRHAYYLLRGAQRGEDRWILAVHPQGEAGLDRELLRRDLRSIAFCFGQPFHVGMLHGLREDGGRAGLLMIAAEGLDAGRPRALPPVPPVPHRAGGTPWPVALFEDMSRAFSSFAGESARGEAALAAASARFLEASRETSAEGAALKLLQGACVAARAALPARPGESLGALRGAAQGRAVALIHDAFSAVGLTPRGDIDAALASAEACFFGEDATAYLVGDVEAPSDERRAAILRAVLVALVAKIVKYEGPICACDEPSGDPKSGWWRAERGHGASVTRVATAPPDGEDPPDVRELLPRISAPEVPIEGLVAAIAAFAEAFEMRTDGLVVGSVRALPQGPGQAAMFKLVVEPAGRPTAQRLLFRIEETGDAGIQITDWDDEARAFSEEAPLVGFLKSFASSEELRVIVQELIILAEEEQSAR
ncbi:hypothetical protein [Sorangium sp. So ce1151]|uniref:hypothetical protein n=1 Tax=Sorangium sp. So ce1151 TaxID=3133332 RepID=UPI003F60410D